MDVLERSLQVGIGVGAVMGAYELFRPRASRTS